MALAEIPNDVRELVQTTISDVHRRGGPLLLSDMMARAVIADRAAHKQASRRALAGAAARREGRELMLRSFAEMAAACRARAAERDEAFGQVEHVVLREIEARQEIAEALGMAHGWDCDWREIVARANELRTTLKLRVARTVGRSG